MWTDGNGKFLKTGEEKNTMQPSVTLTFTPSAACLALPHLPPSLCGVWARSTSVKPASEAVMYVCMYVCMTVWTYVSMYVHTISYEWVGRGQHTVTVGCVGNVWDQF